MNGVGWYNEVVHCCLVFRAPPHVEEAKPGIYRISSIQSDTYDELKEVRSLRTLLRITLVMHACMT